MSARLEAAISELVAALREELAAVHAAAPPRLLSVEEAATALGIGRSMTFRLIRTGRLRTVKVGRRRLIPADALAELAV
ncbi:MAG: helix-turn-helix domain-containing protein [Chloroflexi bacterium]|nr:helix-turn-helix domain-containing protein [Chloroflexota bacterium]